MHLSVMDQGAKICKAGEHLEIRKDGMVVADVLTKDVDSAAFYGFVSPSMESLHALLEAGADISLLSKSGHFKGRMVPSVGKNVLLRIAQYDAFRNPERAFSFAKGIVLRKQRNGLALLDSYSHSQGNSFDFSERDQYLSAIKATENYVGPNLDVLRGLEGNAAKIYFGCFARCLMHGVSFPGRRYHPSTDAVNSALSMGYSMATRNVEALLMSYSFDPMLGFLHMPEYGRSSLSLDMLEEFRHPMVDRMVLGLFNRKIMTPDDFEFRNEEGGTEGQLYMKPDALRTFVKHYETFVNGPNRVYAEKPNISWLGVMRLRIEALKKALQEGTDVPEFLCDGEDEV